MKRYTVYLAAVMAVGILSVWLTGRNAAQPIPPTMMQTPDDIAAGGDAVFVLAGDTLTRLNAQLEPVKSVTLPVSPVPLPPSPIPGQTTRPSTAPPALSQQVPPMDNEAGRLTADAQNVYVLYQGAVYAFDHDLNYVLSRSMAARQP